MAEVEQAVVCREHGTVWAAAGAARPDHVDEPVDLPSAVRWVRRRVARVHAALAALILLEPALFAGCQPTIESFRSQLGLKQVLAELREMARDHLGTLPPPVGFDPGPAPRKRRKIRLQQQMGPDPPMILQ